MMGIEVRDEDTDSLSLMPLAILPFDSVTLRGMNMVKNGLFDSVIQMYKDDKTGAGQIEPDALSQWIDAISTHDLLIIKHVAELHSFDVYCLRIALRAHGIEVNDAKFLKLSPQKQEELEVYVRPFTARLIRSIYGEGADADTTDVSQLLKDADPNKARANLKAIAEKIQINLAEVPQFLEDYGDIYLSISYYKDLLDKLAPKIGEFKAGMAMIENNQQLRSNPDVMKTSARVTARVDKMQEVLRNRFSMFAKATNDMWNDMSAEKFGEFKNLVEDNHTAIGGILCKLTVKMDAWTDKFPSRHTAGPSRMADFLMTDMRQGF